MDCLLWKFEEGTHTTPVTTSTPTSSTHTRTRTETCKTPGWWGCRDETTTTATATATTTSTDPIITSTSESSTSTCKTVSNLGLELVPGTDNDSLVGLAVKTKPQQQGQLLRPKRPQQHVRARAGLAGATTHPPQQRQQQKHMHTIAQHLQQLGQRHRRTLE